MLRTIDRPWSLVLTGAACIANRRGLFGTFLCNMMHGRTPRNMCIADADICSPHELFGTYRRKCTGLPYVRLHGTWYRRDSDTQSSCGCVLMRRIPCNGFGNPFIPSHVRQSHSKRRPCFDLNFPFLMLCLMQRPLQTPLMDCQRPFETPLMDSQRPL